MIALDTARVRDALAPLHAELLRRADAEADRILADASAEARDVVDRAQTKRERIIDSARAAGAAQASMAEAAERARSDGVRTGATSSPRSRTAYEPVAAARRRRRAPSSRPARLPGAARRPAARAAEILGTDAVTTRGLAPAASVAEGAGRRLDLEPRPRSRRGRSNGSRPASTVSGHDGTQRPRHRRPGYAG